MVTASLELLGGVALVSTIVLEDFSTVVQVLGVSLISLSSLPKASFLASNLIDPLDGSWLDGLVPVVDGMKVEKFKRNFRFHIVTWPD